MAQPFPLSPSLWSATAPPAIATPRIEASTSADVCIVGGGYAGLSTALHLAERGITAIVLEAREPGWGGSGRNGGQVIPGLKFDPSELRRMLPGDAAERLIAFAGGTADTVFDLIARHGMDVPHARAGWIQGAHTDAGVDLVRRRADDWSAAGVGGARFLDRSETARLLGTDAYLAGWVDPRGGAVQPLAYARGLARAAIAAGATVHGDSRVVSLDRNGPRWQVATAHGPIVSADRVVVCTNGYTGDLVPGLASTVIATNSFQIATAPLSDNIAKSILPHGHVTSDTRQLLFYFRLDHQNRLLMGGRGQFSEPTTPAAWRHLERVATRMFPQIADAPIAHRWCGRVALTQDFLPHLHEPASGLLIDIGCMGRGIGLQSSMGRAMAEYVATGDRTALPLPITPVKALPLHALKRAYLAVIIAWYRMRGGGLA